MSNEALFKEIQIGDVTLKNRIAMSPMNMGYTGPLGYPSQQTLAWYATRARGGFGLIITECVVMNPHRWRGCDSLNPGLLIDQRYYRFWSELVELIHSYKNARIFMQLSPGWGRQGHPAHETPDVPSGAPSPVPMHLDARNINKGWERQLKRLAPDLDDLLAAIGLTNGYDDIRNMDDDAYGALRPLLAGLIRERMPEMLHVLDGDMPREMTVAEIIDLEDRFAVQASAAYKLGFDGIEIHSPHGYLIHQFLSARSNKRQDEYGGSLENRARFLLNIIEKTRKKVGPDKAFGARFSGDELMPGGLSHEEACQVVAWARDAGINFVNVSQGSYENPGAGFAPDGENEFTRWAPGFSKASGGLPVITPNFKTPEVAAKAVAEGKTDIVSLGRQSIADPYWPAQVKAGREKDIVKCSRCQNCYMNLFESRWMHCTVNPTAGKEKFFPELWLAGSGLAEKAEKFIKRTQGLEQI